MLKQFTGLGIIRNPFDPHGKISVNRVNNTNVPGGKVTTVISNLVTRPALGNINLPNLIRNTNNSMNSGQQTSNSTVQATAAPTTMVSSAGSNKNKNPLFPSNITVAPESVPMAFSEESGPAPMETFFEKFDFGAYPFYNFWTENEIHDDKDDQGQRKLEDIPRFVKLAWNPAPDLPNSNENLEIKLKGVKNFRRHIPGVQNEPLKQKRINDFNFSPDHLNSVGFSTVRKNIINDYLAPGVLRTLTGFSSQKSAADSSRVEEKESCLSDEIDLEEFLNHPDTIGISWPELRMNLLQRSNSLLNSKYLGNKPNLSSNTQRNKNFMEGRILIKKPCGSGADSLRSSEFSNKSMVVTLTDPSLPPLSFDAQVAGNKENSPGDRINELGIKLRSSGQSHSNSTMAGSLSNNKQPTNFKINFLNNSLGGVFSKSVISSMFRPEHAENLIKMSVIMPNMEIFAQSGLSDQDYQDLFTNIPTFPCFPEIKPLEYVGYVIQKDRMFGGFFEPQGEIEIDSRNYSEFIDTKVAYGGIYRYRMRSILRWNRTPLSENMSLKKAFPSGNVRLANNNNLAGNVCSFLSTEWSPYVYAAIMDVSPPPPPDEFLVYPESTKKKVRITFRIPNNPQKDIMAFRLFRKLVDSDGLEVSNWKQIGRDFPASNTLFYDTDVGFFQENGGIEYVYAAQSISYHHEESTLSEQTGVKLNIDYKVLGEYPARFVSNSGVRLTDFGVFSTLPFRRIHHEIIIPGQEDTQGKDPYSQFAMYGRNIFSDKPSNDKDYILRVQSLDTGETNDILVTTAYKNVPDLVRQPTNKLNQMRKPLIDPAGRKFGRLF